jgi:hypothetical protein
MMNAQEFAAWEIDEPERHEWGQVNPANWHV